MSAIAGAALQGILPGFVTGFVLARWGRARARWVPAAFPIGLLAAYALLKHWPPWPWALARGTNDGTQWLLWSVTAAALVAITGQVRSRSPAVLAVGAGLCVAQAWLMLSNLRPRWSVAETALHVAAWAFVLLVSFAILAHTLAAQRSTPNVVRVLIAVLVLDGLVLAFGGSLLLAQLASAIAATLAGVHVASRKRSPLPYSCVPLPLASAHAGVLLAGHHFADPAPWTVLAAVCAPALTLAVKR